MLFCRTVVSRYTVRAVFPVAVAVFRKLREISTHMRANSAATNTVTMIHALASPVPTLPNR